MLGKPNAPPDNVLSSGGGKSAIAEKYKTIPPRGENPSRSRKPTCLRRRRCTRNREGMDILEQRENGVRDIVGVRGFVRHAVRIHRRVQLCHHLLLYNLISPVPSVSVITVLSRRRCRECFRMGSCNGR